MFAIFAAIGTAIASFFTGVGTALSGAVGAFVTGIAALAPAIQVVTGIVTLISDVAQLFVGKPQDELPEDIACRAEAADQHVEDFDSFDDYMAYLRSEQPTDPQVLEAMSPETRRDYALAGDAMYVAQMEERLGMDIGPSFWYAAKLADFSAGRVADLLKEMKANQVSDAGTLKDFLTGHLDSSMDNARMYDSLDGALTSEFPNASEAERSAMIEQVMDKVSARSNS